MDRVLTVLGEAIAITAFGAFAVGVLYGFSCDLVRWWEARHDRRTIAGWSAREWEPEFRWSDQLETLRDMYGAQARRWAQVAELEQLYAREAREPSHGM